jgi:hypothetical protein
MPWGPWPPEAKMKELPACDVHGQVEAEFQCEKCLKHLCSQCINQDAHFYFCRYCGGSAKRVGVINIEPISVQETLVTASMLLRALMVGITSHIIVPAAIIIMVGAFLFYLLEVRSVFLGGSVPLKQIGFCFAAASVLIARYGKVYAIRQRQMIYTGLLAVATFLAMTRFAGGAANFLVNILVILAVWRFASGLTNSLNIEEEEKRDEHRLYGVERIKHEELQQKYDLKLDRYAPKPDKEEEKKSKKFFGIWGKGIDAHGNPSAAVARLAAIAIFAFALGEPFLLAGPPEIGLRALVTVIVFLLAAGVVLAAGSAMSTYRHTLKSGGNASLGMVPGKIAIAVFLLFMILAVALTVPGIKYKGSGILRPQQYGKTSEKGKGREESREQAKREEEDELKKELEPVEKEKKSQSSRRSKGGGQSPAESIFSLFAQLGKILLIPVILIIIGVGIFALIKLWPMLKGMRLGIGDRLRKLLEKLRSLFASRQRKDASGTLPQKDPLAELGRIHTFPPRDAILTAYHCLLAFFEKLGHKRLDRLTPYEFLNSLPERLKYLAAPARNLTEVYVRTAYSTNVPTSDDSKKALDALSNLRHLIETQQKEI